MKTTSDTKLKQLAHKKTLNKTEAILLKIKHCYSDEEPIFVEVPYPYEEIEIVVAYFQFKYDDFYPDGTLLACDVAGLLESFFYGKIKTNDKRASQTIDIYDNWEIWTSAGVKVMALEFLQVSGLEKAIQKIADEVIEAVELEGAYTND